MLPSCDTMVVLAPHTRNGATLLAKNSDRPPRECQPLFQSMRRVHPQARRFTVSISKFRKSLRLPP